MADGKIVIRIDAKSAEVRGELERVVSGLEGFRLDRSDPPRSCDLLVLEIGEDPKQEFSFIRSLQSSGEARAVFLTSPQAEPSVLIQALRSGAKEFFPQPINGKDVRSACLKFQEAWRRTSPAESAGEKEKRGKIIHVLGSKGGVGVTTVAVNLAAGLVEVQGSHSAALMDMKLPFGGIPIFLDAESAFDWGEAVKDISRLDSAFLRSKIFRHGAGVSVLPSPGGVEGVNQPTPQVLEKLLRVMQETFDFTVIDGGASLGDLSFRALEMADQVLVVACLSLPCLTDVNRLLATFQRLGFPGKEKTQIVANRFQESSLFSIEEAEQAVNHKISWWIPTDFQAAMAAVSQGKTLFALASGEEICRCFREMAASFLVEREKRKRGIP